MKFFFVACLMSVLTACAQVGATVSASPDVNPDISGNPQPIALRVFFLRADQRFQSAGSQVLFKNPEKALASDLVGTTQIMLAPGASIWWGHPWPAHTKYIGIAADYRDLWRLPWRIVEPVNFWEQHLGGSLLIQVTKEGLVVT